MIIYLFIYLFFLFYSIRRLKVEMDMDMNMNISFVKAHNKELNMKHVCLFVCFMMFEMEDIR